jgi:hypothetical protein
MRIVSPPLVPPVIHRPIRVFSPKLRLHGSLVEAAGVLLTVHPKEAGVPHITIQQLGRMVAGVEKEAASRLKKKLQNLLGDPCGGYLRQVAIGYHMGGIRAGEVMGTQMTSAGLESGEETIVYRWVTDSSGIDQCNMARVPSQSPQSK